MLRVNDRIQIREADLDERFILASGPGGQNVNKVATAVQLRFNAKSAALPAGVGERLLRLAGRRATQGGQVLIEAKRYRSRERNRDDARARLAALIRKAAEPPPAPRKETRPSRAAVKRGAEARKHRGRIKALRKSPKLDE